MTEASTSRNHAVTTLLGYRNRNRQVLVNKTEFSGNDYNQRVYVLECGHCGQKYGANCSDIWQQESPEYWWD